LIFAAMIVVSIALYRQAWRAWVMLAGYLALALALVATSRIGILGPVIGLDARYTADSVPVFALALALAFLVPLDRSADPAFRRRPLVVDLGQGRRTWVLSGELEPPTRPSRTAARIAVLVLVTAYAASAMLTSVRLAGAASTASIKSWFDNVRTALVTHPSESVVDGFIPARGAPLVSFDSDAADLSKVLQPIAPRVRWNAPAETMFVFDAFGHLRPVSIDRVASARPGEARGCGYLLNESHPRTTAYLERPLIGRQWGIRLGYFSQDGATGLVNVDGDAQEVVFLPGLHPLYLVHEGPVTSVAMATMDNPVCVSYIQVGTIAPEPFDAAQ
jgi:hypothetical protein